MARYIPPAARRLAETTQSDTSYPVQPTEIDQRKEWANLTGSIKRLVNKLNRDNFQVLCVDELFKPNLIRGRGLLCKQMLNSCLENPPIAGAHDLTPIYAALMAVINSQLPNIGKMLCARLIERFFRRLRTDVDFSNSQLKPFLTFLGWLANFFVLDFLNILEIIQFLFPPSLDTFVAMLIEQKPENRHALRLKVEFCELSTYLFQLCGQLIHNEAADVCNELINQYRKLFQEMTAQVDVFESGKVPEDVLRLSFALESVLTTARGRFEQYPQFTEDDSINLVETEDQYTHYFDLNDMPKLESVKQACDNNSDWFKAEQDYEINTKRWQYTSAIIRGLIDEDDQQIQANQLGFDQLADTNAYSAVATTRKLTDTIKSKTQDDNNSTTPGTAHVVGFGGNTDMAQAQVDPAVEQLQIRKAVYLILHQSATSDEIVHRLMKSLVSKYSADSSQSEKYMQLVASTIYDNMLARGTYEKDDGAVAAALSRRDHDFRSEFEELFALTLADIRNKKENDIVILAQWFGDLLSQGAIEFSIFQYIRLDLSKESLQDGVAMSTRVFLHRLLLQLRRNLTEAKLLQTLLLPVYQKHTKQLFLFHPKHYRTASKFYETAGFPLFQQTVESNEQNARSIETASYQHGRSDSDRSSQSGSESDQDGKISRRDRRFDFDSPSSASSSSPYDSDSDSGRSRSRSRSRSRAYRRGFSSSSASSSSRSPPPFKSRRKSSSPPPRRSKRDDSLSSSHPRRSRQDSHSPPSRHIKRDDSRSSSPPPRSRQDSYSPPRRRNHSPPSRHIKRDDSRSSSPPPHSRQGSHSPPHRHNHFPPSRRYHNNARRDSSDSNSSQDSHSSSIKTTRNKNKNNSPVLYPNDDSLDQLPPALESIDRNDTRNNRHDDIRPPQKRPLREHHYSSDDEDDRTRL